MGSGANAAQKIAATIGAGLTLVTNVNDAQNGKITDMSSDAYQVRLEAKAVESTRSQSSDSSNNASGGREK